VECFFFFYSVLLGSQCIQTGSAHWLPRRWRRGGNAASCATLNLSMS
jgi:hypothetical protein